MSFRQTSAALSMVCGIFITFSALAFGPYTVTDLGTLGGTHSYASAINNSGQVVGTSNVAGNTTEHAFLWSGGSMTDLGTLGGTKSSAANINNNGEVVGYSYLATGYLVSHAFLWSNGVMTDLGTLGGTSSYAKGINNNSQVTGVSNTPYSFMYAFLWSNGVMTDLGDNDRMIFPTLGGSTSNGNAINDLGQVVGTSDVTNDVNFHAFIWDPGTRYMTDLGVTWPTANSTASDINGSGHVLVNRPCGDQYFPVCEGAYIWRDGTMTDLGSLGLASHASAINNNDQIVGSSYGQSDYDSHAFLWENGSMADLNALIDPATGWKLLNASDINDNGQITGTGIVGNAYHAFLLTPAPIPPTSADLTLSLTSSAAQVVQGESITYTISVTNKGPAVASGVAVGGTLPGCTIGNLAIGASATCTNTVTVSVAGTIVQTMTVSANEIDPLPASNSASVSTMVFAAIDLVLSLSDAPDPVVLGQTVKYTLTVTNNGPSTATNVVAFGTLPTCNLNSLAPGASGTCTSLVTATTVGTINQSMQVVAPQVDLNTANNSASVSTTVLAATADLALTLSAPASANQGQTVTYSISVTNNGPSPATGVTVTGTLPTCTIGNLASGATANCPASTVTATSTGTLTQTMTVSGTETDTNLANNSKTVNTTVQSVADLSIGLTGTPGLVYQGQTVIYTVSVTNNGPSSASGVSVSGSLPNCLGVTTIASGATATCNQTVTATAAGVLIQTVFVSGIETDSNAINNSASVSTTVLATTDLSLSLNAPASVLQGQMVSYTITVTNNGPSPATGVTASGTLPSCNLGNIASGATATCTQMVTASTAGTLTQTMTTSGAETDPNLANNSASASTTVNPAADLALTMTDSPDPVKKGSKLVYALTLTNNGPSSATSVSLTDVLPTNIYLEGIYASQGKCSGKATVTCAIGTLNSGATATVKITIKPFTVGTITNSATASATQGDPNTANNNAAVTTQVNR